MGYKIIGTANYAAVHNPITHYNKQEYRLNVLAPKDQGDAIKTLLGALTASMRSKWATKPDYLYLPVINGDKDYPDHPAYQGVLELKLKSKRPPALLDLEGNPLGSSMKIAGGDLVEVEYTLFAWDYKGKQGITGNLVSIRSLEKDPSGPCSVTPEGYVNRL